METLIHSVKIFSQDNGTEFGKEKYAILILSSRNDI